MKMIPACLFLLFYCGMHAGDLVSYRDRNRLILVFSGEKAAEQGRLLKKAAAGLEERDVLVIPVADEERKLHEKYAVQPGRFAVFLIGKDGHEAFRSEEIVRPEKFFALIDAMPMRKDEMRQKSR